MHVILLAAMLGNVMRDSAVVAASWHLLAEAAYGHASTERAAFVVRDAQGQLRLVEWPFDHTWRLARYSGALPPGIVAIVHTHPNDSVKPSCDDMRTAARTGVPVYVLTRSAITFTDGTRTLVAISGDWNPSR